MIGIALAFIAALFYGVAAAIQKYSMAGMEKFSLQRLIKNKKWLLSIAITLLGGLAYLFALKSAPLSVVQPFLGITIIVPVLVGVFFFKEKLKVIGWLGLSLVTVGIIIISVY